jgi:spore maturation protein CgeB
MEELEDYFKIGEEILCFNDVEELEQIIDYYLLHEDEREQIREKAYARFLGEHTYVERWVDVLSRALCGR